MGDTSETSSLLICCDSYIFCDSKLSYYNASSS